MSFLNAIKSHQRPLPYTRQTPMPERKKFIKHLHKQGFTTAEIHKVYKTLSYPHIKKIINE